MTALSFETRASRLVAGFPKVLRRVPFTAAVVALMLLAGLLTRTAFAPSAEVAWFPEVAYGVPAMHEGRLWTPLVGWAFAMSPPQFLGGLVLFAALVGACELRVGTRWTAWTWIIGQVGTVLVAIGLVWVLSGTSWHWMRDLAVARHVGATPGILAVVAVTTATLRSPWRLRIRTVLLYAVAVGFLFTGTLGTVADAVAVGGGLLVGQRYLAVERGSGPRTRRETRMLAFVALLVIGVTQFVVLLFPGEGPFGSTAGQALPLVDVLLDAVVIGVVANALRQGRLWAWWVTTVLAVANLVSAVVAVVLIATGHLVRGAPVTLGGALLWLAVLVLLLRGRHAFRVPLRARVPGGVAADRDSTARARELLTSVGGSTMSWMTLWPEGRYWFTADGRGYVGYQRHAGVALALADPVVPADTIADAVHEFASSAGGGGLTPCFFSVTDAAADALRAAGWRTVQIAEDTIIDLPGLKFTGKKWQDVRSAINKAKREGVVFRMVRLADEPADVLAQVRAISEAWVGDKGLPEMGFTLGGVEEALDPAVRVGLAVDAEGQVLGVTSWLPVHAPGGRVRGWTLDVMRRRIEGFRPVMEFMIASACLVFQADGAEIVSLSGAPLAREGGSDDEPQRMDRLLDRLGGAIEPLYGFRSLHAFKAKFAPRYEPVHLAFRDEGDLPRIGIALTRAYLPHATPRQLVAAGRSTREGAR